MNKLINIIVLAISVVMFHNVSFGQTTFTYHYDANGNRESRTLDLSKSSMIDTTNKINNLPPGNNDIVKRNLNRTDIISDAIINLYPNPTKENIEIDINNFDNESTGEILMFDIKGTLLLKQGQIEQKSVISLYNWSSGTYILKIILNGEVSEWKVIKE